MGVEKVHATGCSEAISGRELHSLESFMASFGPVPEITLMLSTFYLPSRCCLFGD